MVGVMKWRLFILYSVLIFLLVSWQDYAVAAERTVEPSTSLQESIDKAGIGDILKVKKGLYNESFVISKPLTLIAEEGVIIDGGGNGNVITIEADGVTVKGFAIQNSGKEMENSGIVVNEANNVLIDSNHISNVLFGVYLKKGSGNTVQNNEIESFDSHFSKRGNGIHLFYGQGNLIQNNKIKNVQDGIYFDFTSNTEIHKNIVEHSRYGFHFMFSEDIRAEENLIKKNITGLMVMDSKRLQFNENQIYDQFHFRGFGVLIYASSQIAMEGNEIRRNSTGIYFEDTKKTQIVKNLVASNQVGLEFKGENASNVMTENNFIGNVVQTRISNNVMRLDNNQKGNYWDDYNGHDISGDGIGEIPYKAGSIYDQILQNQPHWQFYFESPAIKLWSKAESMFPSIGLANVYDKKPLIEPVNLENNASKQEKRNNFSLLIYGLLFMCSSVFIISKGRRIE